MLGIVGFVFRRGFLLMLVFGAGWYGGAKNGAPELLIRAIDGLAARAGIAIEPILNRSVEEGTEIVTEVVEEGSDYVVGTLEDFLIDLATVPENDGVEVAAEATDENSNARNNGAGTGDGNVAPTVASLPNIVLCKMRITNAPRANSSGVVKPASTTVRKNGVDLLLMPATKSCVSSGFGVRNGKMHKGIDYFTRDGGNVLAAGDGVILERVTRRDYGNMLVIAHGDGVFTRYAHLERFAPGITPGSSVSMGQTLGPIGNTGSSTVIHLHYEVLTGEYKDAIGSFALDPVNPFSLPQGKAHTES